MNVWLLCSWMKTVENVQDVPSTRTGILITVIREEGLTAGTPSAKNAPTLPIRLRIAYTVNASKKRSCQATADHVAVAASRNLIFSLSTILTMTELNTGGIPNSPSPTVFTAGFVTTITLTASKCSAPTATRRNRLLAAVLIRGTVNLERTRKGSYRA